VAAILKEKKDDLEALEELFLATLSRRPTEKEKATFAAYRDSKTKDDTKPAVGRRPVVSTGRVALFQDALWAVINTTEFIFNH
jgi:hypothetical protein